MTTSIVRKRLFYRIASAPRDASDGGAAAGCRRRCVFHLQHEELRSQQFRRYSRSEPRHSHLARGTPHVLPGRERRGRRVRDTRVARGGGVAPVRGCSRHALLPPRRGAPPPDAPHPTLRFREDAVALTHDRSRPSAAAPRPPRRGAMDTLLLRPVAVSRAVLLSPPRAVRHRSRRHAPGAVLTVEKFFSSRALRATRSSLLAPRRRPPRRSSARHEQRSHPSSLGV